MRPDWRTRYWSRVTKTSSCWNWTGSTINTGYGVLFVQGRLRTAHRLSWELHHGPIPEGLCVLHRCDNRTCVNPSHLFLGTKKQNTQDMLSKGRHGHGEEHSKKTRRGKGQKLTTHQQEQIAVLLSQGKHQREVASIVGCSQYLVWAVSNNKRHSGHGRPVQRRTDDPSFVG